MHHLCLVDASGWLQFNGRRGWHFIWWLRLECIRGLSQLNASFLKQRFVMSEPVDEDLIFDTSGCQSRRPRGTESTVNIMFEAGTARSLAVAFDFSVSAANAGMGRPAGHASRRASCSRHDM